METMLRSDRTWLIFRKKNICSPKAGVSKEESILLVLPHEDVGRPVPSLAFLARHRDWPHAGTPCTDRSQRDGDMAGILENSV